MQKDLSWRTSNAIEPLLDESRRRIKPTWRFANRRPVERILLYGLIVYMLSMSQSAGSVAGQNIPKSQKMDILHFSCWSEFVHLDSNEDLAVWTVWFTPADTRRSFPIGEACQPCTNAYPYGCLPAWRTPTGSKEINLPRKIKVETTINYIIKNPLGCQICIRSLHCRLRSCPKSMCPPEAPAPPLAGDLPLAWIEKMLDILGLMEKTCWFFVVDDNGGIPCEISLSSYFG